MTDHDRARLRVQRRVALAGPVVGVAVAAASGLAGLSGRVGLALLLACASFGAAVAALLGVGHGIVDEWRQAPVARRRIGTTLALFAAAAVLLLLAGGVAGG